MSTTLIDLIRHGEPEGGPMFRGQTDHPLSELGWHQMRQATATDDHWDVIVTSPLTRCLGFATTLSEQLGLPVHTEERLREILVLGLRSTGIGWWRHSRYSYRDKHPRISHR